MAYKVKIRRGFPSDKFQRDGLVFDKIGRILTDKELTARIKKEPALFIEKVKAKQEKKAASSKGK